MSWYIRRQYEKFTFVRPTKKVPGSCHMPLAGAREGRAKIFGRFNDGVDKCHLFLRSQSPVVNGKICILARAEDWVLGGGSPSSGN